MIFSRVLLILCFISFLRALSITEVGKIFANENCIAGSLSSLNRNEASEEVVEHRFNSKLDVLDNVVNQMKTDKSAVSYIHELAQYNGVTYQYELIDEEGPPHSKIFTVSLYLGDETYTVTGTSIKKAQKEAASAALKNTKYEHPQLKIKERQNAHTPSVLLNNLSTKLGLTVTYTVVNNDILENLESDSSEFYIHSQKSYLQKLNDTIHSNNTIHIRKDESDIKGPFKVKVEVNGAKFIGVAHTIKNAKHEAALKALKYLKTQDENFYCLEEDNCKSQKQSIKSAVSLVYESAQKRNLGVNFEIINEEGPSHKKIFTTKCTIGDIEATGQGKSKKESKRAAAENILPLLLKIPEVSGKHENINLNDKKSKRRNKKNKIIKTTFDKIDRMFDNFVDYGKGLLDKINGNKDTDDNNDNDDFKHSKNRKSPTEELMELGKILDLNIIYSDFEDNQKSYSLLDLGTKPNFICLGEGINKKNSRDLAATHGMDVLYKLGLLDNLLDKSLTISSELDEEEKIQNIWLEIVNKQDEKQK